MQSIQIILPAGLAFESGDTARVEIDGVVIDPSVNLAPGGVAFTDDIVIPTDALDHGLHAVEVTTVDALGNETETASVERFVNTGPTPVRNLAFVQEGPGGLFEFAITPPLEWEQ